MLGSTARVTTEQPSRYLKQVCRHLGHKRDVRFDDLEGAIVFPDGVCRLSSAPGELTLEAQAGSKASLALIEDVVGRHLVRFGHRDELTVTWIH